VDLILWRLPPSRGVVAPAASETSPSADGAPGEPTPRLGVLVGLGVIDTIGSFVFGGVGVLTVYLATTTYGAGDAGTGYLNGAMGVGGLIGAVLSGALVLRPRLGAIVIVGGVLTGVGLIAMGAVRDLAPALLALTVASAGSLLLEVLSTTIFQRAVPDRIRGRALGVMVSVSSVAFAVGSFLLPVLADSIGVTPVLAVAGVAVGVGAIGGRLLVGATATRHVSPNEATLGRDAGLPIFAGLSAARLEAALRDLQPRPTTAGEVIIREGETADRFYVIAAGHVRVTQRVADGIERRLRDMGPDEVFGEIGLLRGSPRTATVTATDDGLLLALDREAFLALVAADTRIGGRLLDLYRGSPIPELRAETVSAG
jgi:hypothetical protein